MRVGVLEIGDNLSITSISEVLKQTRVDIGTYASD